MFTPETLRDDFIERLDCVISMQPSPRTRLMLRHGRFPYLSLMLRDGVVQCQEAICGGDHERTHIRKA